MVKLFCVIIFHEERSSSFCEAYTEIIFNPNRKDKITHLLSYVTKPKVNMTETKIGHLLFLRYKK